MKRPAPEEGRYSKVSRRVWGSDDFLALSAPKPSAQFLFLRLLTGPELGVIPGVYAFRIGGIADAFGWSVKAARACLDEIVARGMAVYDATAGLIWVPRAIAHNPPDNPNVVLGWRTAWKELPTSALKERVREELRAWCAKRSAATGNDNWVNHFDKVTGHPSQNASANHPATVHPNHGGNPFQKGYDNAFAHPLPNPLGNQDQDQDQEQDPQLQQDLDLEASARAREADVLPLRDAVGQLDSRALRDRALGILRRMDARHGGGGVYDFNSWRTELERLALKPAADLERALHAYETEQYVVDNRAVVNPGHLLKYFERYVQGDPSRAPKGSVRAQRPEEMVARDDLGVG